MNINTFLSECRKQIDDFYHWYVAENRKNPEEFPLDLDPGEWDLQFTSWCESDNIE